MENNFEERIFLPSSLIKLVFSVSKLFELSSYNEFSLLDTLEFALNAKYNLINDRGTFDEKEMAIFIFNVILITVKFNTANPNTRNELQAVMKQLGIENKESIEQEFETFSLMNFKILDPYVVELIFNLVEVHLSAFQGKNDVFEKSLDILRIAYFNRNAIYIKFTAGLSTTETSNLKNDLKLFSSSIFIATLKIFKFPFQKQNEIFEKLTNEDEGGIQSAQNLNNLSSIVFEVAKQP
ncbi:CLUMA_CG004136, isoform A [Clunio marinus]|uniref:CLUMA_CG004136, isoform A n=1 Tax=Clunio marinus TaxID=568069 RepID=A0A1J1HSD6_9DIPT|nr:CLUMA_CG004136, isoform A [Clunio marinus]